MFEGMEQAICYIRHVIGRIHKDTFVNIGGFRYEVYICTSRDLDKGIRQLPMHDKAYDGICKVKYFYKKQIKFNVTLKSRLSSLFVAIQKLYGKSDRLLSDKRIHSNKF